MADGSVIIDTELDESGLRKGLANLGSTVATGITTAVAAAGAALVGLGSYAISVGSDFEKAMANVAATMGLSVSEMNESVASVELPWKTFSGNLSEFAQEMGKNTAFTASEAADALNYMALAGYDVQTSMSMLPNVLNLAAAGDIALAEASDMVTDTQTAFGISLDRTSQMVDEMAKAASTGNTSVAQLGSAFLTVGGLAQELNGGFVKLSDGSEVAIDNVQELEIALVAMANAGIKGSEAGTHMRNMLLKLSAPTDDGAAALEALGVAIFDTDGNMRSLKDIMGEMSVSMENLTQEQKLQAISDIFNTRDVATAEALLSAVNSDWDAIGESILDAAGSAQKMADTKLDNLQGDITILGSATEGFGIAMYGAMSKIGEGSGMMRDLVQEATAIMGDLTDAVNENGFDGLVNALGDALARAVNKIVEYVPMLIQGGVQIVSSLVQGLSESAGSIAEAATSLISVLIEGILSITADLIQLGGELIIALCNGLAENAGAIVETVSTGLVEVCSKITAYLPQIVKAGIKLLKALADGILEALPTLIGAIPTILTALIEGLQEAIPMLIECASELILAIVEALPELIQTLVDYFPELIQLIVDTLVENIPVLLDAVIQAVLAIVEALPEIIVMIIDVLPTIIQSICDGLMTLLPQIIQAGITLLTSLVKELPTIINTIVMALPSIINSIVSSLLGMIPTIIDCGVQLLVSLVQALPDIIYAIVNVLPVIIASIVSTLVGMIPTIIQCGIDLLVSLVKALPEIIIAIVAVIPQIISSIIQALLDAIPLIIQCGIELLVSLIGALPDIIVSLVSAIPEIISSIINALLSNIPLIIQSGIDLFVSLIKNLPKIIVEIVKAVPQIISALVDAFKSGFGKIVEVGGNLIKGLWDGMLNLKDWIVQKAKSIASSVLDGIKSFFGINSPSKVFKEVIGENLMLGLAEGIAEEASSVMDEMEAVAEDIAGVEFTTQEPEFDFDPDDVDFDDLIAKAHGTVKAQLESVGTAVSAGAASTFTKEGSDEHKREVEDDDKTKPQYVENNIYIDGKQTARVITPYVEKELAWEDK